jgi:hypothetical protein
MITGTDNILVWLEENGCPYWAIYQRKEDDQSIMSFWPKIREADSDNTSMDAGLAKLASALRILDGGTYYLMGTKDLKDQKNRVSTWITKEGAPAKVGETPAKPAPDTENIDEMVTRRVTAELERRAKEDELKRMKDELKEYKRKDDSYHQAVTAAIGKVMPFVESHGDEFVCGVINFLNGHRGPVAVPSVGQIKQSNMEEVNKDQARLENIVKKLRSYEGEQWLDLLEALVAVHDSDPATYNMARNFLLKR